MVATRRGVRVYSPSKTNPDRASEVQATPSTGRRTRSSAKQAESSTQHAPVETCSHLEKSEAEQQASPPASLLKRCSRASRLHSPEQPCTPVSSTHEADTSDVESCCSAVSDIEPPMTRTRGRRRQPRTASQEDEDVSEVESCSSAVSASKGGCSIRRSTRRKAIPERAHSAHAEAGDVDSCGSVVSESQRVTRSQRKTALTRSSVKQQTEDSELSDADSIMSGISGADVSKSTSRRAMRSRRQTGPIPIRLDEELESPPSPAPTGLRSRPTRGKMADVSDPQSCDSEGFESGPTYSAMNRRRGKAKALDSDSEPAEVHSPTGSSCSTRSSRSGAASRRSVKDLKVVVEKVSDAAPDTSLDDSRLESTVIGDCTLTEENQSQILEEKETDGVNITDLASNDTDTKTVEKGVTVIPEGDSHVLDTSSDIPGAEEEAAAVSEAAVTVEHQQEEMCDEKKDEDSSEMETMRETVPSPEPVQPCQSVTVTLCEENNETEEKDEAMETADADVSPPQGEEAAEEDSVVETRPSEEEEEEEEEKMEVSTLHSDAQQVFDSSEAHVESIQVTSSQQHNITVERGPEQQHDDVIVQSAKVISLLESDEDEDEDEDEEEGGVSEEEDAECMAKEEAGPSNKSEAAGTSVDGLFMIDTRPGQEADKDYYMEKPREEEKTTKKESTGPAQQQQEEEEEEEFVDEEDDDDDEDANVLFSSRNPLLKEMSSRIDPGIRVKQLGGLYINFDGSKSKAVSSSLQKLKEKKIQDEVMKKSVIGPDFEKKDAVPPYIESKQALKLKRRAEREKSTGDGWFNMKAPEISQELKGDLQVLKMRGSLDPKRFYKKNDRDGFPKYFQVGTVVDSPVDFYHSRVPKKERKRTMVEELLADAEFRQNNKKKFQKIAAEKAAQGAGKRNKKKFHKK